MRHGLMYQGSYEQNFASLSAGRSSFIDGEGNERSIPEWPAEIDGVRFGYLERVGRKFAVSRVQFGEYDIVIKDPVLLDQDRHLGGKRMTAAVMAIRDEEASNLLDDLIARNPEQAEEIGRLLQSVNQLRRTRRGD